MEQLVSSGPGPKGPGQIKKKKKKATSSKRQASSATKKTQLKCINNLERDNMPYFREEDKDNRDQSWSQAAPDVLVLAIQTIDQECFKQIQDDKTPLGNLRHRLDLILNSNHWNKKRDAS